MRKRGRVFVGRSPSMFVRPRSSVGFPSSPLAQWLLSASTYSGKNAQVRSWLGRGPKKMAKQNCLARSWLGQQVTAKNSFRFEGQHCDWTLRVCQVSSVETWILQKLNYLFFFFMRSTSLRSSMISRRIISISDSFSVSFTFCFLRSK
ncbi:MAG: hypothetical protein ACI814_005314 [Mariniblastus sp.]|jgi:hypothetical protein